MSRGCRCRVYWKVNPLPGRQFGQPVHGLTPGMEGQIKSVFVHVVQGFGPQILESADAFLRRHVHAGPVFVVSAVFHQCEGDVRETLANLTEAGK